MNLLHAIPAALLAFVPPAYSAPLEPIPVPAWVWSMPAPPKVEIRHVSNQKLQELCRMPGYGLGGCTFEETAVCRIFLNEKLDRLSSYYRRILKHEEGHCHGWPGDHPATPTLATGRK